MLRVPALDSRHMTSEICQRQQERRQCQSRWRRGHQLTLGSEVAKGMKSTAMIVLLVDDKNSDNSEPGSLRGRPSATRVQAGAEFTKRTSQPLIMRTRTRIKSKSKAAGRGAERLASTTVQGVYPRPLSGLSVPRGLMGLLALEQPPWIEEREQVETRRDIGSSAPQQILLQENTEDGKDLHQIPGNLLERERSMLQMTQAERERGAVSTIKCKLCPKAQLGRWVTFQRHCNTCEKHPLELYFCPRCGDVTRCHTTPCRKRRRSNGSSRPLMRS